MYNIDLQHGNHDLKQESQSLNFQYLIVGWNYKDADNSRAVV